MAQHLDVLREQGRYTRADFIALRAWLLGVDARHIVGRYHSMDDVERNGWDDVSRFASYLARMRDDLANRLVAANPYLSEIISEARRDHRWNAKLADALIGAADTKACAPRLDDPVSRWFLPIVANKLRNEGISTLGDLIRVIRMRGLGWYKPIPYLGRGKAEKITSWLRSHEETLGPLPQLDKLAAVDNASVEVSQGGALVPLERVRLGASLDGSDGINRHPSRPLIEARNDLQAVEAYLYRYRGHDHTYRAYQREIERFLLWCVVERGKPLSSALVIDCEHYKDFLSRIPDHWIGVRRARKSPGWRPFAGQISRDSQRYAVQTLRAFFDWLCDVRYLSANPWLVVQDPQVERRLKPMRIEKAMPSVLWQKMASPGGILDTLASMSNDELIERYRLRGFAADHAAQARLVRAALLILSETGLRREELAYASRQHLVVYRDVPGIWRLDVLGKRNRWRSVYITQRTIDALKAHWDDRGEDFTFGLAHAPLIAPVIIPPAPNAVRKHSGERVGWRGFSPDGLYGLIKTWLTRIADDEHFDLSDRERALLRVSGVHTLRHTFGTLAVADGMPLDVAQRILGHASLQTTTIYVQSEDRRAAEEVDKWIRKRAARSK